MSPGFFLGLITNLNWIWFVTWSVVCSPKNVWNASRFNQLVGRFPKAYWISIRPAAWAARGLFFSLNLIIAAINWSSLSAAIVKNFVLPKTEIGSLIKFVIAVGSNSSLSGKLRFKL